jgi:hypothetical protein
VEVWIWGIRYGLTNNLTIGLIPKYFSRTANVSIPVVGVDVEPGVRGFGDTVFLTKYRLWGKRRAHLSAFHLLSIPTGDEDAEGEDKGVMRRIPLGSGNFDFTPGLAFTTVMEPLTIHANIWYVIAGGEFARQAGDEFRCDLALTWPPVLDRYSPSLELNYRWQDSVRKEALFSTQFLSPLAPRPVTQETMLTEAGGHTLFLSPGARVLLTKWLKAEIGIQIPIVTPDDGWAEGIVFHLGLTRFFF